MSKPRECNGCKKIIPYDHGYYYDAALNLICPFCNKIAYPSNESGEKQMRPHYYGSAMYHYQKDNNNPYQGYGDDYWQQQTDAYDRETSHMNFRNEAAKRRRRENRHYRATHDRFIQEHSLPDEMINI